MEYRYGVCICDLDITNTIKDLEIFDTYEEACFYYLRKMHENDNNLMWINPKLWIVWIRKSDNQIEQFDRLTWKTKCRIVNI